MKRAIILKHLVVKALATPPLEIIGENMKEWSQEEQSRFISESQILYAGQAAHLHESGLWDAMEERERDFIETGPMQVSKQALVDAYWLAESAACLLWALCYVSELPPYDQEADVEIMKKLPAEAVHVLVKNAILRTPAATVRQRDLAELWHWRSCTRQLQESGGMPQGLPGGKTIEEIIQMASAKAAEDGAFPAAIGGDFPAFGKPYRNLNPEEFSLATSIAMERHRAFNWLCGYSPGNRWADTPTDT